PDDSVRLARGGGDRRRRTLEHADLRRAARHAGDDPAGDLHPLHRQLSRLRQCLRADRRRRRRQHHHDEHLHLRGVLPPGRHRRGGRGAAPASRPVLRGGRRHPAPVAAAGMKRPSLLSALRWLVFIAAALVLNFPVISTAITSLKSDAEIAANASLVIEHLTLANYARIFAMADRFDILHYLANSVIEAAIGATLSILLALPAASAQVAFGVGEKCLLPIVTNLRAIPLIIFSIPIYLMYQEAHLLDTRLGLALILCLVNLPLVLVLLANAVRDLPVELDEAARI